MRSITLAVALTLLGPGLLEGQTARPEVLKVCVRPNPGFLEPGQDGPVGLEFDLLTSFAEAHGLRLELMWLESFKDLLPSVETGTCDMGAAGVMMTEQRSRKVDFSQAYFPARILYVEPRGELTQGSEELSGKRIAVVGGTLHEDIVAQVAGAQVLRVDDDSALFQAVVDGRADGAVCDSAIVLPFLSQFPDLTVRFAMSERASFAFPLSPGSIWKKPLDEHLTEVRRDGRYRSLLVEHFGEEGAEYILDED